MNSSILPYKDLLLQLSVRNLTNKFQLPPLSELIPLDNASKCTAYIIINKITQIFQWGCTNAKVISGHPLQLPTQVTQQLFLIRCESSNTTPSNLLGCTVMTVKLFTSNNTATVIAGQSILSKLSS